MKGKILSDGKKISGRGRLTDKVINTMQNYYGIAIPQNSNDLLVMRKSFIVNLMHNTNLDDAETCHRYCPKNINNWCKYQKNILTREKRYRDHVNLPLAMKKEVEPIFKDLSSEALLSKRLDSLTQNNNKSLNGLICK